MADEYRQAVDAWSACTCEACKAAKGFERYDDMERARRFCQKYKRVLELEAKPRKPAWLPRRRTQWR